MPSKNEDEFEKVLEKKFFCPTKFAQEIEYLVRDNKEMNYIDAIIYFCECNGCLLYTSPSPRDKRQSRMPSSA